MPDRPLAAAPQIPVENRALVLAADADEGFARGLAVTLRSLLESAGAERLPAIYILDCGLGAAARRRLDRVAGRVRREPPKLVWLPVAADRLSHLPAGRRFPPVVYARLLIPELLPASAERALYLDSDLLVRRDVCALLDLDLQGAALAAVQDLGAGAHASEPDRPYFNTGVLVIDPAAWRRESISERAMRHIADHGASTFPDQDALNATIDRWLALDPIWNFQLGALLPAAPPGRVSRTTLEALRSEHRRDGLVAHYTVAKPWRPSQGAAECGQWLRCYARSGWQTRPRAVVWLIGWIAGRLRLRLGSLRQGLRRGLRRRRAPLPPPE